MSPGLITFDLDDTLWDVGSVILRAEQAMAAWLDQHHPAWRRVGPDGLRTLRGEVLSARPDIAHDLTALRLEVLRQTLQRAGLDRSQADTGARGAFAAFFTARNQVTLFEHVRPVLTALASQQPLYALSNGNADIIRAGLGDCFSAQFSAASVGHAKPHPRMFEAALARAGVAAADAIHIGDHPEQDVAAAQAVGMRAIWVNFRGDEWPLARRPDGEIRDFLALPEVIAGLRRQG